MKNKIAIHKKLTREQNYWLLAIGGIVGALAVAFVLTISMNNKFTVLGLILFLLVIAAEVYSIIKLSKCLKALNEIGMEIATDLATSCNTQKELKDKLIDVGIARNWAVNYSIRVLGTKRTDTTPVQTITYSNLTEIKCPQCHTDKLRWIPYEKTSFGATFYVWLILSLLGYSFSSLVTMIMLFLFVLTLIVKIIESRISKKVNCYQCNICGHKFEIPKQSFYNLTK